MDALENPRNRFGIDAESIDLDLWRRVQTAPKDETWKWNWDTWDPIINVVYNGKADIRELECPVCGEKRLYAFFLVVYVVRGSDPLRFVADRYFGCQACQTQMRDRGETPLGFREEEARWAIESMKEQAEREVGRKLKGVVHFKRK